MDSAFSNYQPANRGLACWAVVGVAAMVLGTCSSAQGDRPKPFRDEVLGVGIKDDKGASVVVRVPVCIANPRGEGQLFGTMKSIRTLYRHDRRVEAYERAVRGVVMPMDDTAAPLARVKALLASVGATADEIQTVCELLEVGSQAVDKRYIKARGLSDVIVNKLKTVGRKLNKGNKTGAFAGLELMLADIQATAELGKLVTGTMLLHALSTDLSMERLNVLIRVLERARAAAAGRGEPFDPAMLEGARLTRTYLEASRTHLGAFAVEVKDRQDELAGSALTLGAAMAQFSAKKFSAPLFVGVSIYEGVQGVLGQWELAQDASASASLAICLRAADPDDALHLAARSEIMFFWQMNKAFSTRMAAFRDFLTPGHVNKDWAQYYAEQAKARQAELASAEPNADAAGFRKFAAAFLRAEAHDGKVAVYNVDINDRGSEGSIRYTAALTEPDGRRFGVYTMYDAHFTLSNGRWVVTSATGTFFIQNKQRQTTDRVSELRPSADEAQKQTAPPPGPIRIVPKTPPAAQWAVYLGCGEATGRGTIFRVDRTGVRARLGTAATPYGLAADKDGLVAALTSSGMVVRIDTNGKQVPLLHDKAMEAPINVATHPATGEVLVCDNKADVIVALDPERPARYDRILTITGHEDHLQDMNLSVTRKGEFLFGGSGPTGVYRFKRGDKDMGEPLLRSYAGVAADPTSDRWVAATEREVVVFEANRQIASIAYPSGRYLWLRALSFAPDGTLFLALLMNGNRYDIMQLDLDKKTFRSLAVFNEGRVASLAVAPLMRWAGGPAGGSADRDEPAMTWASTGSGAVPDKAGVTLVYGKSGTAVATWKNPQDICGLSVRLKGTNIARPGHNAWWLLKVYDDLGRCTCLWAGVDNAVATYDGAGTSGSGVYKKLTPDKEAEISVRLDFRRREATFSFDGAVTNKVRFGSPGRGVAKLEFLNKGGIPSGMPGQEIRFRMFRLLSEDRAGQPESTDPAPAGRFHRNKEAATPRSANSGRFTVNQTWTGDFDKGKECAQDEKDAEDFWFDAITETDRQLVPRNGALFAALDSRPNSPAEVAKAIEGRGKEAGDPIDVRSLRPGRWFGVRTSKGNYAIFTLSESVGASPGKMSVIYHLWDASR